MLKKIIPSWITAVLFSSVIMAYTSPVSIPHIFRPGSVISASQVNENFRLLEDRINQLAEQVTLAPAGIIMPFGGTSDKVPEGWLICDGREVSREQYSRLFSVISLHFGEGDGVHTFNIPDLRGVFIRGSNRVADKTRDDMYADPDFKERVWYDRTGKANRLLPGDEGIGTYQEDEIKKHNHEYTLVYGNAGRDNYGDNLSYKSKTSRTTDFGGRETRSKNVSTHFIIKY